MLNSSNDFIVLPSLHTNPLTLPPEYIIITSKNNTNCDFVKDNVIFFEDIKQDDKLRDRFVVCATDKDPNSPFYRGKQIEQSLKYHEHEGHVEPAGEHKHRIRYGEIDAKSTGSFGSSRHEADHSHYPNANTEKAGRHGHQIWIDESGGEETVPKHIYATFIATYSHYFDFLPVGSLAYTVKKEPPQGWLVCNGDILDTSQYCTLFEKLKYEFVKKNTNQGFDERKFSLPDLTGLFLVDVHGKRTGDILENTCPYHSHTASCSLNGKHTHVLPDYSNNLPQFKQGFYDIWVRSVTYGSISTEPGGTHSHNVIMRNVDDATRNRKTMPKSLALLPIIKAY